MEGADPAAKAAALEPLGRLPDALGPKPCDRPDAAAQIAGLIFGVLLIDGDGTIVEVNHAAENLLGIGARRLCGRGLCQALGVDDERVAQRLAEHDAPLVARDLALSINRTALRINLTASPVTTHAGWRVITLSDVGHEEGAQNVPLSAAIAAPSILAHEIKNPLAAIRGAGQLIARKLADKDRGLARMITDEVDRIARLIDRMQQLGRTESDPPSACNLHEAIRAAVAVVTTGAGHEVQIREEFDPSLPPVLANRDALEQVLINLISNAREAALAAGDSPQVTLKTRFVSGFAFSAIRLGRAVRLPIEITISDNGAGIDPTMRDHVFEPFVSTKQSGQGLGLALVRKLVRDMSGNISHERDNRAGQTHFRLHLPQALKSGQARDG